MLDLWQWGVLAFLALGWALSEVVIVGMKRRAARERERLLREAYVRALLALRDPKDAR